jgi:NitT/TauT family transport system substrate-binding protein
VLAAALVAAALALSACGGATAATGADGKVALRLGYFPNLTHAGAIVGVDKGMFATALGTGVTLTAEPFNAGPAATEAFLAGDIDATFIGPSPAINAYVKSQGQALRIISGATSGGAALVVKASITSVAQLRGTRIATPQLGNTQDVALRYWLSQNGLHTDTAGGGDVSILPQSNSQTLQTFKSGQIDGAWVPEPWATMLVDQAGGKVLVNETSLWPQGQFATTVLIVRTDYLGAHPDVIKNLLKGLLAVNDWMAANPAAAQDVVNKAIDALTGQLLPAKTIADAWKNLTFTADPMATSLRTAAQHAQQVGLLSTSANLDGICDLTLLNEVLKDAGKPAVQS